MYHLMKSNDDIINTICCILTDCKYSIIENDPFQTNNSLNKIVKIKFDDIIGFSKGVLRSLKIKGLDI